MIHMIYTIGLYATCDVHDFVSKSPLYGLNHLYKSIHLLLITAHMEPQVKPLFFGIFVLQCLPQLQAALRQRLAVLEVFWGEPIFFRDRI